MDFELSATRALFWAHIERLNQMTRLLRWCATGLLRSQAGPIAKINLPITSRVPEQAPARGADIRNRQLLRRTPGVPGARRFELVGNRHAGGRAQERSQGNGNSQQ